MTTISVITQNIFESGTVTVNTGGDTGYPEERLFDRSISTFWKYTGTALMIYKIDQGASPIYDVDFFAIGRHNFDGENGYIQYSDNDIAWSSMEAWTPISGQITTLESSAINHRYWRFWTDSMTNPVCSEMFLGAGATFTIQKDPAPEGNEKSNVQWNRTVGDTERATKHGDERRIRTYDMFLSAADLTTWRAAMDWLEGYSKPFYIVDHEGDTWFCRFESIPLEMFDHRTHTHVTFTVIEEL